MAAGCRAAPPPEERRVVVHRVAGCDVAQDGTLTLRALGDFTDERAANVEAKAASDDVALPFTLQGVEASIVEPAFRGVGYANAPDDVHLSLWSSDRSCTPIDDVVPASSGGPAMSAFADGNAVIVAGLAPDQRPQDSAFALVWDTRKGVRIGPSDLNAHRLAFASVTPFGAGALVAGGADPKYLPIQPVRSALVFRDGAFQEPPVVLGDDYRARHGAVVLADGETLLVGGEDERGAALSSLVAVAPTDAPPYGQSRASGLGSLAAGRKFPVVLRLANGRVLVAGGTDDAGQPVPTLEWFAPDGAPCPECPPTLSLFARPERAYVALAAGGALAVGAGPDANNPSRTVGDVWWITDDGALEELPALTADQVGAGKLRLVPGSNGAPWLWNGAGWFRFDPWQKKFIKPNVTPSDGPDVDLPAVAIDPGLFVWLERDTDADSGSRVTRVRGFRHDVRGPLARDTPFLFAADHEHVVPDRPPGTDVIIDNDGLHLANGGSIVIADSTYADAVITGKTRSTALPGVKLGADYVVGSADCVWPSVAASDAGDERSFEIHRTGTQLEVRVTGSANVQTCAGPAGRISVGLTSFGSFPIVVSDLSVTREAGP
jgi:hypothetical protein